MRLLDRRDVPVSTDNRDSLARYETAADQFHSYFGNPLATIDEALAADPQFVMGHCLRAGMLLTATEKGALPLARASVEAARRWVGTCANDRERGHIAAARAWLDGDFEAAVERYGAILHDYPRDTLALQLAHLGDFFLGRSTMLRDRVAQVLPHWSAGAPGYGYVLGMHAFGLEETGLYDRAEATGRPGARPEPPRSLGGARRHARDGDAGPAAEGIAWLTTREAGLGARQRRLRSTTGGTLRSSISTSATRQRVLEIYDTPHPAAALGGRAGDDRCDRHAVAAAPARHRRRRSLARAGLGVGAARRRRALRVQRRARDDGIRGGRAAMRRRGGCSPRSSAPPREQRHQRRMTREVGLPLARALAAFGAGDYAAAVRAARAACGPWRAASAAATRSATWSR